MAAPELLAPVLGRCSESFEVSLPVPKERGDIFQRRISSSDSCHSSDDSDDSVLADMRKREERIQTRQLDRQMELLRDHVSQKVARMDITHSDVLRVTPAFRALQNFGKALRSNVTDLYYYSERSEKISTFWSHSWHGPAWMKILTLVYFYNGTVAIFMGFLMALVVLLLSAFGMVSLPEINPMGFGSIVLPASSLSGFFVTMLVMILWRPREKIFLDRVCVSQNNQNLKAQAIFSLAGMLRQSDRMLILWDPTWTDRLWCLFELAAFLKSKQDHQDQDACRGKKQAQQVLVVRPTLQGSICILLFVFNSILSIPLLLTPGREVGRISMVISAILSVVGGYPAVRATRGYFRSLETMEQQLQTLSFDKAECHCCKQNHRYPSGRPMLCDKQVVKDCVNLWFGSQGAFEHFVRSTLSEVMTRELNKVWSFRSALGVSAPIMWLFMDAAAFYFEWEFRFPPLGARPILKRDSTLALGRGIHFWLVGMPPLLIFATAICKLGRRSGSTPCREIAKNLLLLCSIGVWMWSLYFSFYITSNYPGQWTNVAVGLANASAIVLVLLTKVCKADILLKW